MNKIRIKNEKLLQVDIFKYNSNHVWITQTRMIQKIVQILNNLFVQPDNMYLELYRQFKLDFNDSLLFWVFLISLHTNCWEEAIKVLECHSQLDILSEDFKIVLNNLT